MQGLRKVHLMIPLVALVAALAALLVGPASADTTTACPKGDFNGDVEFISDGRDLWVRTQRTPVAAKLKRN